MLNNLKRIDGGGIVPIRILECPSCSGNIDFYDETKLFGRCTSCGREVQRTEPEKIIIQGNYDDSNQVIKQGMDHLELDHFSLAENLFKRYIEKNPKRYEGYYGMLLASTRNFNPKSLDCGDVGVLSVIESHMRDVSKTADTDTTKLIRERLDQFYVEYREYALKDINDKIDANEKETEELKERIERDRRELNIDSLYSKLQDAKVKREADLKGWDKKIKIATFCEKHRKLFIWIIVFCLGAFQKGPNGDDKSALLWALFFFGWLVFLIGFPILCYSMRNKSGSGWYPIANSFKKKKELLAEEPYIPGNDMCILNDYEKKKYNLTLLNERNTSLMNELAQVAKMDTPQLMLHRAK